MINEMSERQKMCYQVAVNRGWSMRWDCRYANVGLEAAEFAEAVRGKSGNKLEEAADLLFTILTWFEAESLSFSEVIKTLDEKIEELKNKPKYKGEQIG